MNLCCCSSYVGEFGEAGVVDLGPITEENSTKVVTVSDKLWFLQSRGSHV